MCTCIHVYGYIAACMYVSNDALRQTCFSRLRHSIDKHRHTYTKWTSLGDLHCLVVRAILGVAVHITGRNFWEALPGP